MHAFSISTRLEGAFPKEFMSIEHFRVCDICDVTSTNWWTNPEIFEAVSYACMSCRSLQIPPRIRKVGIYPLEMPCCRDPLEMNWDNPPLEPKIWCTPLLFFAFLVKYPKARNCMLITPKIFRTRIFLEGYRKECFFLYKNSEISTK